MVLDLGITSEVGLVLGTRVRAWSSGCGASWTSGFRNWLGFGCESLIQELVLALVGDGSGVWVSGAWSG